MPANAIGSIIGWANLLAYASMQCVRASMPVAAVTAGGTPSVSIGST
jgi:hypothetical protein